MPLTSVEDLRTIYRPPGRGPVDKVIHHLDAHCVDFLAKAPFFVLSTSNAEGVCDGSPKGGPFGDPDRRRVLTNRPRSVF